MLDLEEIAAYIAQDSLRYAKETVRKVRTRTKALRQHPNLGRAVPETEEETFWELIEGAYRIIYHLGDEDLVILMVLHSARLLDKNMLLRRMLR